MPEGRLERTRLIYNDDRIGGDLFEFAKSWLAEGKIINSEYLNHPVRQKLLADRSALWRNINGN